MKYTHLTQDERSQNTGLTFSMHCYGQHTASIVEVGKKAEAIQEEVILAPRYHVIGIAL